MKKKLLYLLGIILMSGVVSVKADDDFIVTSTTVCTLNGTEITATNPISAVGQEIVCSVNLESEGEVIKTVAFDYSKANLNGLALDTSTGTYGLEAGDDWSLGTTTSGIITATYTGTSTTTTFAKINFKVTSLDSPSFEITDIVYTSVNGSTVSDGILSKYLIATSSGNNDGNGNDDSGDIGNPSNDVSISDGYSKTQSKVNTSGTTVSQSINLPKIDLTSTNATTFNSKIISDYQDYINYLESSTGYNQFKISYEYKIYKNIAFINVETYLDSGDSNDINIKTGYYYDIANDKELSLTSVMSSIGITKGNIYAGFQKSEYNGKTFESDKTYKEYLEESYDKNNISIMPTETTNNYKAYLNIENSYITLSFNNTDTSTSNINTGVSLPVVFLITMIILSGVIVLNVGHTNKFYRL